MLKVREIIAKPDKDGMFAFFARLELFGETYEVPVSLDELQSYSKFQTRMALLTGQLFWCGSCESKSPEAADSSWRAEVSQSLSTTRANEIAAASKAQGGTAKMN